MIPALVVLVYLAIVLYLGLFAFRKGSSSKPGQPPHAVIFPALGGWLLRSPGGVLVHGFLPVLPMVLGSAFWMAVGSWLSRPPSRATVERYFPEREPSTQSAGPGRPVSDDH